MNLDAHAAGVHLAATGLAKDGDRLVLHYGQPLAVTGGVMRQTSITGYSSSGAYQATTRDLDLAVRCRHHMAQMVYQRPLGWAKGGGRISGFAAAAHHRNWSHQGGLTNNLVMIGLSVSQQSRSATDIGARRNVGFAMTGRGCIPTPCLSTSTQPNLTSRMTPSPRCRS